jgi:NAD-dependent deacetylase sirtuin 2
VPRLLINREVVGEADPALRSVGYAKGLDFGAGNYRDALHLGDCDGGVRELCRLLEWEAELDALVGAEARAGAASLPTQAAEAAGPQV